MLLRVYLIPGGVYALEEVLGEEVSKAVGYRVEVKAEWCEEVSAIVWAD